MRLQFFYYISKSKVDMLLAQLEPGWKKSLGKIVGGLTFRGVKIDTELSQPKDKDLTSKLVYLEKLMRQHNQVKPLPFDGEPYTGVFLDHTGYWRHGPYDFDKEGGPTVCFYVAWKEHNDSLILLVGSAGNILGDKVVEEAVFPSSAWAWLSLSEFISESIKHIFRYTLLKSTSGYHTMEDERIATAVVHDFIPSSDDKGAAIAEFCYSKLIRLEDTNISTIFILFNRYDVLKQEEEQKGDFPQDYYKKIKRVYVGSPLYTTLA